MSETRTLRERQAMARAVALRTVPLIEDGGLAMLAQTRALTSYPTTATAFYACSPIQIDGPETEGATATLIVDSTRTFLAFNMGTQVPPLGTPIIAHACGGRWTFRFDG